MTYPPPREAMTVFAIAEPCIGERHAACIEVCPVDCIRLSDRQSFIDPSACIACGACLPACPVGAIFPVDVLPPQWVEYARRNAEFFLTAAPPSSSPA